MKISNFVRISFNDLIDLWCGTTGNNLEAIKWCVGPNPFFSALEYVYY